MERRRPSRAPGRPAPHGTRAWRPVYLPAEKHYTTPMLAAAWSTLRASAPAPALARLAQGGVGRQHLADTAGLLLNAAPALSLGGGAPLAFALLLAAWEDDPLDGDLAGNLLAAQARVPFLPPALLPALELAHTRHRRPANLAYFLRLASRREYAKLTRLIAAEAGKDPDNLFWPQRALIHAAVTGDWDFALGLTAALPPALAFLHAAARAQAAFFAADWAAAGGFLCCFRTCHAWFSRTLPIRL